MQQTTQVTPLMLRLPGGAASIMTGQELVVPRRHMHIASQVTQHMHHSSLEPSARICLGTSYS